MEQPMIRREAVLTSNETPRGNKIYFFPRYNRLNIEYVINGIDYRLREDVLTKFRQNLIELYNN